MASLNIPTSLPKFGHVGATIARRSTWNPNLFFVSSPRTLQSMSHPDGSTAPEKASEAVKHGVDETIKTGENMKNKAASAAEQAIDKTKEVPEKISETAQDVTEKAKQTVQDVWGSAKDTAQKAKDTVIGKAEDSKEAIKENLEIAKRSMNSKN